MQCFYWFHFNVTFAVFNFYMCAHVHVYMYIDIDISETIIDRKISKSIVSRKSCYQSRLIDNKICLISFNISNKL